MLPYVILGVFIVALVAGGFLYDRRHPIPILESEAVKRSKELDRKFAVGCLLPLGIFVAVVILVFWLGWPEDGFPGPDFDITDLTITTTTAP